MVRTSGGIRISAGKSSKKGGASGGGSRSTPSTPSGKSSGKGTNRLPPIPHCEAPSWQKPITNFFNSDAGPSREKDVEDDQDEEKVGCSSSEENTDKGGDSKTIEKAEDKTEQESIENNSKDESSELPKKMRREGSFIKDIHSETTEETKKGSEESNIHDNNESHIEDKLAETRKCEESSKENVDSNILK